MGQLCCSFASVPSLTAQTASTSATVAPTALTKSIEPNPIKIRFLIESNPPASVEKDAELGPPGATPNAFPNASLQPPLLSLAELVVRQRTVALEKAHAEMVVIRKQIISWLPLALDQLRQSFRMEISSVAQRSYKLDCFAKLPKFVCSDELTFGDACEEFKRALRNAINADPEFMALKGSNQYDIGIPFRSRGSDTYVIRISLDGRIV